MGSHRTPSDCPHVESEREIGALTAKVEALSDSIEKQDLFLRKHMEAEEIKLGKLYEKMHDIQITMSKWLGGGVAVMIMSDWIMRVVL